MRQNQINNRSYLAERRKQLRNNLTPAEAKLWLALKSNGLKERKFRRQHSIGNYIVDFYCPSERLIIELDGNVHADPLQSEYDAERDKQLVALGCKIVRFENSLVFNDLEGVLNEIERHFGAS